MYINNNTKRGDMDIPSKVIELMDQMTMDFALLIDLGPLQFSAEDSYRSLEGLTSIYYFGFTNLHCMSLIALSSGANVVLKSVTRYINFWFLYESTKIANSDHLIKKKLTNIYQKVQMNWIQMLFLTYAL